MEVPVQVVGEGEEGLFADRAARAFTPRWAAASGSEAARRSTNRRGCGSAGSTSWWRVTSGPLSVSRSSWAKRERSASVSWTPRRTASAKISASTGPAIS
nr:hypothetical protein [Streptomyces sp. FXJ7.023]